MGRSREITGLVASIATSRAVVMSDSVDCETSKKDGAPSCPANDRAQGGDAPAFLTEGVLLRFEEGLRAQREHRAHSDQSPKAEGAAGLSDDNEERRFSEPDAVYSRAGARPLGMAGLLLCALLLVIAAAALRISLKAPSAGSSDAAPVNIEAHGSVEAPRSAPPPGGQTHEPAEPSRTASVPPDSNEPRQPIRRAVKSSSATPSLPPLLPPPVEAQGPATPAGSETAAVAQPPVEEKAKGARTKSRRRHARFGRR